MYSRGIPGEDRQNDEGVDVWRLRCPRPDKANVRARYLLYEAIARWAREGEIDLVEVPDAEGWSAVWPRLPVPVLSRVHGCSTYFAAELDVPCRWITVKTEGAALRRADFWSSVSGYAARRTQQLFGLKPADSVLYPIIHLPPPKEGPRQREKIVLYMGTLTLKKGVMSLIRAWPLVRKQHSDAELHLFGKDTTQQDGTSTQAMLAGNLDASIRGSVCFHGHAKREDLDSALENATAAVFPSYAEAFATAPIEAMAYGCPTIYTRRCSGPELIDHGVNGLLVEPSAVGEIADAINLLLNDAELAAAIGRRGYDRARNGFTAEQQIPRMLEFYEECMHRHRNGASKV
jgi:glycosyltransferase involved in cell wall biosynthesis